MSIFGPHRVEVLAGSYTFWCCIGLQVVATETNKTHTCLLSGNFHSLEVPVAHTQQLECVCVCVCVCMYVCVCVHACMCMYLFLVLVFSSLSSGLININSSRYRAQHWS